MRNVAIIFEPGCSWHRYVSGVYKIKFGEKFYIGRTYLVYKRWYDHYLGINTALNSSDQERESNAYSYYGKLIKYLLENPKIKVGYMQLIYQTDSHFDMCTAEDRILRSYKGHRDILNRELKSEPSSPSKFMIKLETKGERKYFYNQFHNEISVEGDYITSQGTISKRKAKGSRKDSIDFLLMLQDYMEDFGKEALCSKLQTLKFPYR